MYNSILILRYGNKHCCVKKFLYNLLNYKRIFNVGYIYDRQETVVWQQPGQLLCLHSISRELAMEAQA